MLREDDLKLNEEKNVSNIIFTIENNNFCGQWAYFEPKEIYLSTNFLLLWKDTAMEYVLGSFFIGWKERQNLKREGRHKLHMNKCLSCLIG